MIKEELLNAGINYDEGVHRFAGRAPIYEKYLNKFFASNFLPDLYNYLSLENYDAAFRLAHDLKGTAGNLSLSRLYTVMCQLVDALRIKTKIQKDSVLALYLQVEESYTEAKRALKE